jgi:hypothetical protein
VIVGVNNQACAWSNEYAVSMIGIYAVYFEVPADMAVGAAIPLSLAVQMGDSLLFGNGSTIPVQ